MGDLSKPRDREGNAGRQALERAVLANGLVGSFQVDQYLKRRKAAVEG